MLRIEISGAYGISEVAGFHVLKGETINSIIPLSSVEFLCTVLSGSLHILNTSTKTTSLYS